MHKDRKAAKFRQSKHLIALPKAPIAQLDRALPSEGRGQRFESSWVRQLMAFLHSLNRPLMAEKASYLNLLAKDAVTRLIQRIRGVAHKMAHISSKKESKKLKIPYVKLKGRIFYYRRRVPHKLRKFYRKGVVEFSLGTQNEKDARELSSDVTAKLNKYWLQLSMETLEIPASHLLVEKHGDPQSIPKLSEALALYIRNKNTKNSDAFVRTSERAVRELISCSGDMEIDKYDRTDALKLRDKILGRGLAPQSAKRLLSVVRSVINLSINEYALPINNVFSKLDFGQAKPVHDRTSIPVETIKIVQQECMKLDDDKRWLVALIADTGMRLSEGLGLLKEDIVLDHDVPHLIIQPHPWRSLKTNSSERKVPLIGSALWAAERIRTNVRSRFAFPAYVNEEESKTNSVSAVLNKWLKTVAGDKHVIHGFRHSFRDRLRAIQCPIDMIDQLGGWKQINSVGNDYGEGYDLYLLRDHLRKMRSG